MTPVERLHLKMAIDELERGLSAASGERDAWIIERVQPTSLETCRAALFDDAIKTALDRLSLLRKAYLTESDTLKR